MHKLQTGVQWFARENYFTDMRRSHAIEGARLDNNKQHKHAQSRGAGESLCLRLVRLSCSLVAWPAAVTRCGAGRVWGQCLVGMQKTQVQNKAAPATQSIQFCESSFRLRETSVQLPGRPACNVAEPHEGSIRQPLRQGVPRAPLPGRSA